MMSIKCQNLLPSVWMEMNEMEFLEILIGLCKLSHLRIHMCTVRSYLNNCITFVAYFMHVYVAKMLNTLTGVNLEIS